MKAEDTEDRSGTEKVARYTGVLFLFVSRFLDVNGKTTQAGLTRMYWRKKTLPLCGKATYGLEPRLMFLITRVYVHLHEGVWRKDLIGLLILSMQLKSSEAPSL